MQWEDFNSIYNKAVQYKMDNVAATVSQVD